MPDWSPDTWTAAATVVIALFTIVLAASGGVQAYLTRRAINLAQAEFNATHRPKIVIHAVETVYLPAPFPNVPATEMLGARVTFFNEGNTNAKIIEIRCDIYAFQPPLPPSVNPSIVPTKHDVIQSGIGDYFVTQSRFPAGGPDALRTGESGIFCVGRIFYADLRDAKRQTGFVRRYNPTTNLWEHTPGDSRLEYAY